MPGSPVVVLAHVLGIHGRVVEPHGVAMQEAVVARERDRVARPDVEPERGELLDVIFARQQLGKSALVAFDVDEEDSRNAIGFG